MFAIREKFSNFSEKFKQLPKYQRYLSILLTSYFVYSGILGLIVPYAVEKQLPVQLESLLKRPVSLDDVSINPFTLNVVLTHFKIDETDNREFVGFDTLGFELRFWHSLFNGAISISDVSLTQPFVFTERLNTKENLQFNFSDILAELAKSPESPQEPSNEPMSLPHVIVEHLSIANANFLYSDTVTDSQLHYPAVDLKLKGFDTLTDITSTSSGNHFSIHFVGKQGGDISTQGQIQVSPFNIVGELALTAIKLPHFWSFISDDFKAKLETGQLNFQSHFEVKSNTTSSQAPIQVVTSQGAFSLENILFTHEDRPLVSLPLLALEGIELNLDDKEIVVNRLHTENLDLNASITSDGIDIVPLFIPSFMANSASETGSVKVNKAEHTGSEDKESEHSSLWSATLSEISVKDYALNIQESLLTENTPWRIAPINLTTGSIQSDFNSPIEYRLDLGINAQEDLGINAQGKLTSTGKVEVNQQHLNADLQLTGFSLKQLQPYLAPFINITVKNGELNSSGRLEASSADELSFVGDITVNELLVKDNQHKKTLLKWQSMAIEKLNFDQGKQQLTISQINFSQPYSRIIIAEDKSTNFQQLLVSTPPTPKPEAKETPEIKAVESAPELSESNQQAPLDIRIGKITVSDGSTFFADNSLTPNFAASIEQVEGSVSQLSSLSDKAAVVDIKGKIDKYAPVTLKGEINPLLEQPYLDLDLDFNSVELTSVNPYSGTYAGYYIDKGQLSLELSYLLKDNKLNGSNHIVVNQLKLGEPSDSSLATSLPVTLAIALLQDRHGVIDLGLEVSGDLDSPDFSVGSIVMTAFTNVITKAVTAPFTLLAGLFGDDEELDKIEFAAGNAQITDKENSKLATLATALLDRPKLTLSIEGAINSATDSRVLQEKALWDKLAQLSQLEIEELPEALSPSTYPTQGPLSKALIALYETELMQDANELKQQISKSHEKDSALSEPQLLTQWHIALYNHCLNRQVVDDNMLGTLASERAQAVKAHLININKVPANRIFLLDSRVDINQGAQEALLTLGAD
ncbi:DUF748 domain-containing protein [Shewanella canadensis]|uniref:DUF748 domain-containing protein n=1 Tax=Shewanella canadensis TaxID=271096 RepID=A0A431WMB3_9GAMM|nr:DUF748 domain-containing protein [Shewanella canadensis]RTR36571.1 DUF748 domain-containing protein [Shewanella canadensis]